MMRRLVILSVVLSLAACGADEAAAPQAPKVEAVPIFTTAVRNEDVVDTILSTGEVRADKTTQVKARVSGIIDEIYVKVGDNVKAGEPLFRTRQVEYRNRVDELEQAEALAEAELEQAGRELDRATQLRRKGVVSQGRMDAVTTEHSMADAKLGIARAELQQARQNLADTIVRAPYDGVITARLADEGTMMQMTTGGTPVLEIVKLDVVEVVAQVPAVHLAKIRPGDRVVVDFDGLATPIETTLAVINDKIDAKTRSVEIRLRVDNPDRTIKPGLFAKVTIYPAPRRTTVVDRRAIQGIAGDNYVFVPDGGIARRRSVRIKDLDAERVEVLSGLKQGELALAGPNLPDVRDGAPIAIQETGMTPVTVRDGADAAR